MRIPPLSCRLIPPILQAQTRSAALFSKKSLKTLGIANIDTQKALNDEYRLRLYTDPNAWAGVVDDNEEDDDLDW